ncbi:MAG: PD-(D/E)XK nuclease family protein, partial [Planctomycetes bacterium]|nr:PD-(D/E)XK nuclease family protein [Planctomycetota bacterium]
MRCSLLRLGPGQDADLHVVQALQAALRQAPLFAVAPVVHVTSPDRRGREIKHQVGASYPEGSPERVARALLREFAPALVFRSEVERDFDFFAALDEALRQLASSRRPGRPLVDQLLQAHKRVSQALPPGERELDALLAPLGERGRLPALVLRLYAQGLRREGKHDPEDALWLAAQSMPGWAPRFSPALVVMDELDRVTPARRAFLAALLRCAGQGLVVLRGSAEEVPFEAPAQGQLQQLVQELEGRAVPVPALPSRPNAALLADWMAGRRPAPGAVTLLRPATRAAEVRDAARIIKRAKAAGEALSGICVSFPQAGAYRELIEETFTEAGIAYDSPFETPLASIAPVAALMDLLHAAQGGLERLDLLDALRSPFLGFGAGKPRELLEQVEQDTREAGVTGGVDPARDWAQPLEKHGKAATAAGKWLGGILRALQPFTRPRLRAGEFFRAVQELVSRSSAVSIAKRGLHRHALHGLERLLQEMSANFARLGDPMLRLDELSRALAEQLQARSLREPEAAADRVRVVGMKELRGAKFDRLVLLGLTDGDLPLPESSCLFFPPSQEQALATTAGAALARELCSPVDVAAQSDYLFGAALTAAPELVLSFPAGEGDSPFVPAGPLARLLGSEGHEHLRGLPDDAPISPGRLALELGRRLRALELEPGMAGTCTVQVNSAAVRAGLLGRAVELCRDDSVTTPGEHDGVVGAWPRLAQRFGAGAAQGHVFSPSQLDTYATCPMRFWARYVLGVKVPDEPTLDTPPNAVGTLLHKALEHFVLLLRKRAGQPAVLPDPLQREGVSLLQVAGS